MKQLIWLGTLKDLFACLTCFIVMMTIAFVVAQCDNKEKEADPKIGEPEYKLGIHADEFGRKIYVLEIEGCEYICYNLYCEEGLLTHKGNCKNPIHIYNK